MDITCHHQLDHSLETEIRTFGGATATFQYCTGLNARQDLPPWFLVRDSAGLAAVASVFAMDPQEIEVSLQVRPELRRRGMGTALLRRVLSTWARGGAIGEHHAAGGTVPRVLLVHDQAADGGEGFLAALPVEPSHREYRMEYHGDRGKEGSRLPSSRESGLEISRVGGSDLEEWTGVLAEAFGSGPDEAREMAGRMAADPDRQLWIGREALPTGATARAGRAVACATLQDEGSQWSINTLGVVPEARGRGHGRAMLGAMVAACPGDACPVLDVNAVNPVALGLYLTCGFVITRTVAYHVLSPQW